MFFRANANLRNENANLNWTPHNKKDKIKSIISPLLNNQQQKQKQF